jgi:putative nucleotidyltransferase with HDIG domain
MSSRRPKFTSPLKSARNTIEGFCSRPFKNLSPRIRLLLGFIVLVLTCTFLLLNGFSRNIVEDYQPGDIVYRNVISPADITSIDTVETARRRNEAMKSVRPVFTYNSAFGDSVVQSYRSSWLDLQKQIEEKGADKNAVNWVGEGGPQVAAAIAPRVQDSAALDRLTRMLRETASQYIYRDEDAELLRQDILLVDARNPTAQSLIAMPQMHMMPLSAARQGLETRISQLPRWSQAQISALKLAMLPLIQANVVFDANATEAARQTTAEKLAPATVSLKRNQMVAREGDTVNESMLAQFAAIREHGRGGRQWHHFFGLLALVTALFWTAWKFVAHGGANPGRRLSHNRAFALIGSAVVVQIVLMRVGFTLADRVASASTKAPFNDATVWSFAIPFAAAALLVGLLLDTQLAFITGLVTAMFAAMIAPNGVPMAFYALISCSAAIYGIGRYRERQSVTIAGLFAGLVNILMAVAIIGYAQQPFVLITILLTAGCGFLGGVLTSIFTAGGLPVNESAFGILTDVKLLELSNADLPVLGQLALRAPGTNQHSHAVGQLAEEACRAIGANPLIARIGALYHDIGKLAAPDMFVENQRGANPHDRIRPSNSARIITSHVTYGMKLAKEIGLPKQIADFIPQHHGTRTLHFFLRKAQAMAADGEVVDESEFRYPGPKPQFKEAAVMMLADSCEAGARSLARPDPENIRAIVTKIVDAILSDGQLDECDLTLREVTKIRESVIGSLTAIYHARIDYPGFNPPRLSGTLSLPDAHLDTEERGVSYKTPSEVPVNKSGEVEDEAIPRKRTVA